MREKRDITRAREKEKERERGAESGRERRKGREIYLTRPAWAGFKTAEEGRAKNM